MSEEFPSLSGAIDFGKDYEYLMPAYYSLKLSFDDEIKDFKISTNNDDMGDFDDIVIELTLASGEEHVFVIQLKHYNRQIAQITLINNKNNKFGLKKYSKAFQKVKENYTKTRSYTAPFENFHFVLFTNSNFEKSEEIEDHWKKFEPVDGGGRKVDSSLLIRRNQKHFSKNLINVSNSDENSTYEISSEVEGSPDDEFFKQFSFYTKQKSVKEMESLIAETILKKFKGCDPNTVVNYLNYFNYWCRRDFGIFKLTKKDVRLKIAELVLTPYIPEPDRSKFGYFSESCEEMLYNLFSLFDVVLIDNQSEEMINRILSVVLRELPIFTLHKLPWSLPVTGLYTNVISNKLQMQLPPSAFSENFSNLSPKKLYILSWHIGGIPLVVKIDKNSSHPQDVLLAIDLCQNKEKTNRIILIDENHHFKSQTEWNVFEHLSDLSSRFKDTYDSVIQNLTAFSHGHPAINLQRLISEDDYFMKSITSTEFISMLGQNFIIGSKGPKNYPKFSINRVIPKVLLDANIVNDSEKDLFVISGNSEMKDKAFALDSVDLEEYLVLKQFGSNKDYYFQRSVRFFISATNGCSKEQFQEICSMSLIRNCHHVRFLDKDRIEWIESTDVRGIRKYFLDVNTFKSEDFVKNQDIFNYFTNKINIICADPGMGKSVMMKYLMLTCPSDYWCIMISLGEHAKFFTQERNLEEILTYFFKQECQTVFEEKVINSLSSRKQILFLWDGFDELPEESKSSVILAIRILNQQQYPQWISARISSRNLLETNFKTLALTLKEFSQQDQYVYVYKHLMDKYEDDSKVEQIIDEVNKNITTSLTCGYLAYTGVPLQTHMVVEIYLRQSNKLGSSLITLTDIYQEFIRGKFDNFFEKADADTDNHFMQDICEEYSSAQLILYENAAMKTAFNDESLDLQYEDLVEELEEGADNLGLIVGVDTDKRVIFAHKTYEEFLSASWLAKRCHTNPEYVRILFKEEYSNIRFMFDMLLARNSTLHLAVLYKNIEMIKTHEDELETCKDKGGRNVIQLACSWGRHHPFVKVIQKDEVPIKNDIGVDAKRIYSDALTVFENKPNLLHFLEKFDETIALETAEELIKNSPDQPSPDDVIMINPDSIERRTQDDKDYLEILEYLLNHRCDVFEPDELLQWNAFQYADHSFSLGALNLMLKYHDINIDSLVNFNHIPTFLFYSVFGFYDNLFRIIPEVPYVECKNNYSFGTLSLLQAATEADNVKAVSELLKHQVYREVINTQSAFSGNPLSCCSFNGNLEMMDILLENGASVHGHRFPPLCAAAFGNKLSIFQKLLLAGADVNEIVSNGLSALMVSIMTMMEDNFETAKFLLEHGADVNRVYKNVSPLTCAILLDSLETVKFLLKYKPDLNRQCQKLGYTALHCASEKGNLEMVKCLIQHGADAKLKSKTLLTPLHVSLANKNEEVALELIEVEPSVINEEAFDEDGNKLVPMIMATVRNFPRVIKKLVQNGGDVNQSNGEINSLDYAVSLNFDSCAKVLIEAGASVNQEDTEGCVPLFCSAKHLTTTKLLLDNGATLTARDSFGNSVLHYAARGGNLEVAEELVKRGADMNAKNNQNYTPLCEAVQGKQLETAKFFLDKTDFFEDGPELLCLAVKVDLPEIISFLIDKGVDVNSRNAEGYTPLISALLNSNNNVSLLLQRGADPNLAWNNAPPLFFALWWGNTDLLNQLIRSGADPQGNLPMGSLHTAAKTGDIFSTVLLIGNGADVNMMNENGHTPLHILCNHMNILPQLMGRKNGPLGNNKEDCARELIAKGANINQKDIDGMTPLHVACHTRDETMIKLLIQKGADINASDNQENSPLRMYFSKPFSEFRGDASQNTEVLRLLIINGANLHKKNKDGWTPLHFACFSGDLDGVKFLIESGADPNACVVITPLQAAAMNGQLEIVNLLLNLNADLSKRCTNGNSAIFTAAFNNHLPVVKLFSEYLRETQNIVAEKKIDLEQEWKKSFLMCASKGHLEILKFLHESGLVEVDDSSTNPDRLTALHNACQFGHYDVAKYLIDNGANVNGKNIIGKTPLHFAYSNGWFDIVRLLIGHEAEVDSPDGHGNRGSFGAAANISLDDNEGKNNCTKELTAKGANINQKDLKGMTPLHVACQNREEKMIKLLIQKGADVNALNNVENSPLHMYFSKPFSEIRSDPPQNSEVVSLLTSSGANLDQRNKEGYTPLHCACISGDLDGVLSLIKSGADPNACAVVTPLQAAAMNGQLEIVNLLLNLNADLSKRCTSGNSAIFTAAFNNHLPIVKLFSEYLSESQNIVAEKKIDLAKEWKKSFLMCASKGHLEILKFLHESGLVKIDDSSAKSNRLIPLHNACQFGHYDVAKYLIDNGANVNRKNIVGKTPLHIACANGWLEIVKLLIEHKDEVNLLCNDMTSLTILKQVSEEANISLGDNQSKEDSARELTAKGANINQKDIKGMTPLHVACQNRNENMIKLLIQKGADVNALNKLKNSPLHEYFSKPFSEIRNDPSQNSEVVRLLISSGANPDKTNEKGFTPLHCACISGDLDGVLSLIESGADPNACAIITPLHVASMNGQLEIVNLLLNLNADLSKRCTSGNSAIFTAAFNNHLPIVKLFSKYLSESQNLEAGKKIDLAKEWKKSFLMCASKGHLEILKFLHECGLVKIDDSSAKSKRLMPLHNACQFGHYDVAKYLIDNGANVNRKNIIGKTPLHIACANGWLEIVKLLIEHKDEVNGQMPHLLCNDMTSLTNLTQVSEEANISLGDNHSKEDCARELITKRANINQKDSKGMTPLHVACQNRDENMIKLLIQKGADVNALNKLENSPLHEYFSTPFSEIQNDPSQNSEVVRLLISSGANPDKTNEKGLTPLHYACFFGDLDGVLSLMESGADPNACAVITPLHAAAMNGYLEIVTLLLNLNADLSKRSTDGNTAIFFAASGNHLPVVKLFFEYLSESENLEDEKKIDLGEEWKKSFLMCASKGHLEILKFLHESGLVEVDDSSTHPDRLTALHNACQFGHYDVAKYLIDNGANLNAKNFIGKAPLHFACTNGWLEIVKLLIEHKNEVNGQTPHLFCNDMTSLTNSKQGDNQNEQDCTREPTAKGANINEKDLKGMTPLHVACQNRDENMIKLLIQKGADVTALNSLENSPLHLYFSKPVSEIRSDPSQNSEVVRLLISFGANLDQKNEEGWTPLHRACYFGDLDGVLSLMESGADPNVCAIVTPLHAAATNGHLEIISLLLKNADLSKRNILGDSAIFIAAFGNHLHVVKLFSEYLSESQNLEDEEKIDLEQEWKKSFLVCASKGHLEILKFLHESGLVEVDDSSAFPERLTALHYTCEIGHYDVTKYLIDNGANVNVKNFIGITPLHFACVSGCLEIVRLLIEHGAEVDCPNDHGNTGLFTATANGHLEIVKFLYEKGARIHVIDEDGDAPLHDAACKGHLAVVEFLVGHNAVLDCQNKNGKTAFDLAVEQGHDEIADFLKRKLTNL